jgi:hypothetical protein
LKPGSPLTILVAALLLSGSVLESSALAQATRVGPTFTINRLSNGRVTGCRYTDVAWDPVNQVYLVIWGSFGEILGRFVTPDGAVLGAEPFVIPTTASYTDAPRVAYSPDAVEFMVVWRDNRQDPNFPTVWGRQLAYQDGAGVPRFVGADFAITLGTVLAIDSPAITYSTVSREFFVIYNRGYVLRGRRFSTTGELIGTEIVASTPPPGSGMLMPSLTYNPAADEYFVVWLAYTDPIGQGIQGRRIQAGTLEPLGATAVIEEYTTDDIGTPAAAFDPINNRYLTVWYRGRTSFNTMGRMVAADGTPSGNRFTVAPNGTHSEMGLARNPRTGTFLTVFAHHDILDIFGAQVSAAGVPDAMMQISASASSTGVDYARTAAATDRAQWLVTGNNFWDKALGQRVESGNTSTVVQKATPINGAIGVPGNATLAWSPVVGATYQVCVDTSNNNQCDTTWQPASTTSLPQSLADGIYYWQVRSTVNGATAEADGGMWWNFSVGSVSIAFGKQAPTNGSTGLGFTPTLTWASVANATYQVCLDTTNNGNCDTSWQSLTSTTLTPAGLAPGVYYWQVRAIVSAAVVDADGGNWWSFGVTGPAFPKVAPTDGLGGLGASPTLQWGALAGANYYQFCLDSTGNNACDTGWFPAAGATSVALSGLASGTYYWQVRASYGGMFLEANGGTWWSFTVGTSSAPPGAFGKVTPGAGATGQATNVTLGWGASSGATSYEYCLDATNNAACDGAWQPASSGVTVGGLPAGTTFYWQVRARNSSTMTLADGDTWWSFTTASGGAPTAPTKISPASGTAGLGAALTLQWTAVAGAGYTVCWDTTDNNSCDSAWWPNGGGATRSLEGLAAGTYYWQVRVHTSAGVVETDSGTWWSFTVGAGAQPPGAFGKVTPGAGATGQATNVTLGWGASSGATSYEYCLDATNNSACDGTWQTAASGATVTGLTTGTTYYWQVRARNGGATTLADGGTWWSFATAGSGIPSGPSKLSPASGTAGLGTSVTLQWTPVANAGYTVCWDTTDNNNCDSAWWPNGGGATRSLEGLAAGTYYWQVRVYAPGMVETDSGTWWSFTVGAGAQPPGAFGKVTPGAGATGQATNVTLGWGASSGASSYEYCLDTTNNNTCDGAWQTAASGAAVGGLATGTTYYWQVRARNSGATTLADGGTWWSFATAGSVPPSGQGKLSPASGIAGLGTSVTLQWTPVADSGYTVCWDTTDNNNCDSAWWPNGGGATRLLNGLAPGTYYWQVRVYTGGTVAETDGGTWWNFTVGAATTPPGAFGKSTPPAGATGQATGVALNWGPSSGASSYEYCLDATNNDACDGAWQAAASGVPVIGLATSTTYYWQVRARNSVGTTFADGGTWWSFTTSAGAPTGPTKISPTWGTTGLGTSVTLQWTAVANSGYTVCWDTTNNNSCDNAWWPNGGGATRILEGLAPGTYYWQVRVHTPTGVVETDGGTWWSFTVGAPPTLASVSEPPAQQSPQGVQATDGQRMSDHR